MNVLFLDDDPARRAAFRKSCPRAVIAETAESAIGWLKYSPLGVWDEVSLDHDLEGESYVDSLRDDCGMEVVRWVCLNKPDVLTFIVHTHNDDAGDLMVEALDRAGYRVLRIPFWRSAAAESFTYDELLDWCD